MNNYASNCEREDGIEDYAYMTITRTVFGREIKIPLTLEEIKRAYIYWMEVEER